MSARLLPTRLSVPTTSPIQGMKPPRSASGQSPVPNKHGTPKRRAEGFVESWQSKRKIADQFVRGPLPPRRSCIRADFDKASGQDRSEAAVAIRYLLPVLLPGCCYRTCRGDRVKVGPPSQQNNAGGLATSPNLCAPTLNLTLA